MNGSTHPTIIQGGMGIGVSDWRLAGTVASLGHVGVVSGTGLETVLARRLQLGDANGDIRRALRAFPVQAMSEHILERYFIEGGKSANEPFRGVPMYSLKPAEEAVALSVVANFVEVFLAKELGTDRPDSLRPGSGGLVGINYLHKIDLPLLPSIYGALLAGVDYIIVGAGNPEQIPMVINRLCSHERAELDVKVQYASGSDRHFVAFDPGQFLGFEPSIERPDFLAIVASVDLARQLMSRETTRPDGFIVEGHVAGGHNAPPRGPLKLDPLGQPIYSALDDVALNDMTTLGAPFWLAGSYATHDSWAFAIAHGATGIQVGTAFAFCEESGLRADLRAEILREVAEGRVVVRTDPRASPTGFPFKVVEVKGTLSEDAVYADRRRVCDAGFLRVPYSSPQGALGYRCAAEPESIYERKGGRSANTLHRKCLCNALLANIGLGQVRNDGSMERALITAGDDLANIHRLFNEGVTQYSAKDVIRSILNPS